MRKKSVYILVAMVLIVLVVCLTACSNFIIPNVSETTPNDRNSNEYNNEQETPNTSTNKPTLSVIGKTFVFDTAAVEYIALVYPDSEDGENESLQLFQEIQMYVNEINAAYIGSKLIFKENNIVEQVFDEDSEDVIEYNYVQSLNMVKQIMYIYIGTMESNGKLTPELEGSADTDTLLLSMVLDEDETCIVYLQFVVQE